jgi:hypothetical protein
MRRFLFIVAILAATSTAVLAGESPHYIVWGAGNDSCAKFLLERGSKSAQYHAEMNWIAGSISRANVEWRAALAPRGIDKDILKGLDTSTLESWLSDYCQKNPAKNLSLAALALEKALYEHLALPKE